MFKKRCLNRVKIVLRLLFLPVRTVIGKLILSTTKSPNRGLDFSIYEFPAASEPEREHPGSLGIDRKRCCRERDAVGHGAAGLMQAQDPGLARQRIRQRQLAAL